MERISKMSQGRMCAWEINICFKKQTISHKYRTNIYLLLAHSEVCQHSLQSCLYYTLHQHQIHPQKVCYHYLLLCWIIYRIRYPEVRPPKLNVHILNLLPFLPSSLLLYCFLFHIPPFKSFALKYLSLTIFSFFRSICCCNPTKYNCCSDIICDSAFLFK